MKPDVDTSPHRVPPTAQQTPPHPHGMHASPAITLLDLQRIIERRGKWLLITLLVCVAGGMLWTVSRPRYYASTAEIIIALPSSNTVTSGSASIPLLQDLQGLTRSRSIKTQVRVLESAEIRRQALLALPEEIREFATDAQINVVGARDSDIVSITVTARHADAAAQLANALVDAYIARDTQQYRATSKTAIVYIQNELARVGDELREAREQAAAYKRRTGLFIFNDVASIRVRALADLESQIKTSEVGLAQARQDATSLKAVLKHTEPQIIAEVNEIRNPRRTQLEQLIQQYEARRVELLQTYKPTSPEIQAIDEQIAEAQDRLVREFQTIIAGRHIAKNPQNTTLQQQYVAAQVQISGLQTRIHALKRQHEAAQRELQAMTNEERRAMELISTVTQLENTYQLLNQNYQTLRISEEARLSSVQVITSATPASTPVSPNIPRALGLVFFLGLCIAVVVAFLMETQDDRIRSLGEVEQISGLPVLSQVPKIVDEPRLAHQDNASFALLESFRMLRSNLLFANLDRRLRIIAVSSTCSGEGKSTTAINLAIVMAMSGKRVVLVDGDLHRPSLPTYLEQPTAIGISNVVTGNATLAEALQPTAIADLSLLTTGPLPPSPSEMLNSQSMRAMIDELAATFDAVIIDAPPTVGLSDTPIITTFADGLLLVVSAKETRRRLLKVALRSLHYVNAPLLGCVLNKVIPRDIGYGGDYDNAYYGYGRDREKSASLK